ncbi:uncharacterized protein LOC144209544 isoform X1 [Stigmatopora nigra]
MADLAFTTIETILTLCIEVYKMVNTAKSNKDKCQKVGERVCTLEKMVQSLEKRPENISSDIKVALEKFHQSLLQAIEFMSHFSKTKKIVSFLKSSSHESTFQEINQKLTENIQLLSLALQIDQGNTINDGLRAMAAQHRAKDCDHPMPLQYPKVPLKYGWRSHSFDAPIHSSNPASLERANTVETDEPLSSLNLDRQSSFDMYTADNSPITAMTPTSMSTVTAMTPTSMSTVTAMTPTSMSTVTAMTPTSMSTVTAMTPTSVSTVTPMNPTPMFPVTPMNPTSMFPVTPMNPTPMSPVTAMNASPMSPVTAMNPSPMSPVTAMNPSPMSPVTAMNPSPMSPVTAMNPSPMSPVTAMNPSPMFPVPAMNPSPMFSVPAMTPTPVSPVNLYSYAVNSPRPMMVIRPPPVLYRPPLTVTSTVISNNGQYPRAALKHVRLVSMVPPAVFQQNGVTGNAIIRNIYH